ncbi:hypothetical protein EYF80_043761 [Liparis tanakae]|uniref:Uncharacterized protein n=1 Tax=Liparis tanakae TaxID=230148 RepID=A0A4Z2G0M0_9TELE|nr:hypothetical protein EYF80_043761 [Liparis tanakae]
MAEAACSSSVTQTSKDTASQRGSAPRSSLQPCPRASGKRRKTCPMFSGLLKGRQMEEALDLH